MIDLAIDSLISLFEFSDYALLSETDTGVLGLCTFFIGNKKKLIGVGKSLFSLSEADICRLLYRIADNMNMHHHPHRGTGNKKVT